MMPAASTVAAPLLRTLLRLLPGRTVARPRAGDRRDLAAVFRAATRSNVAERSTAGSTVPSDLAT